MNHQSSKSTPPSRVVVLGGTGLIGRSIVARLRQRNMAHLALGRSQVNLEKPGAADELAALFRADDAVVAVAGISPIKTPARLRSSLIVVEAIAEALRSRPVAHIVNLGSDSVFADSPTAITEGSCRSPSTLYGLAHLAREIILERAAGATPIATIRPSLLFSAGAQSAGYCASRFIQQAENGRPIVLFGDGEEQRDHVWLEDVSELAIKILLRRSQGSLNAASGVCVPYSSVACAIAEYYGPGVEVHRVQRQEGWHSQRREFNPAATFVSFDNFAYTDPFEAFKRIRKGRRDRSN